MAKVDAGLPFPKETPTQDTLTNDTVSNNADSSNATVGKFVSTPEGSALAYGSLLFMALFPIFFGALRSVSCAKSKVTYR